MRQRPATRDEILDRVVEHLRREGAAGAGLRRLSEATGVARASLYHHFPRGKQEILAAACRRLGRRLYDATLPALADDDPDESLCRWISALSAFYDRGRRGCLLGELALGPAVGELGDPLARALRLWLHPLDEYLQRQGVPPRTAARMAEDAVGRVLGGLIVSRVQGSHAAFQRVLDQVPEDLTDFGQ